MRRNYDIFEKFPDGSTLWRACVSGQFDAQRKVQELIKHSHNNFFAIDISAGEVLPFNLIQSNSRQQRKETAKRIA
jgi:hypothetical protein